MTGEEALVKYEESRKSRLTNLLATIERTVNSTISNGHLTAKVQYNHYHHTNEDIIELAVKYWEEQGWKVKLTRDSYSDYRYIELTPKRKSTPPPPKAPKLRVVNDGPNFNWSVLLKPVQPLINWLKK